MLASVALNQLDRVGIHPFGADLGQSLPVVGGKQSFRRLLSYLERLGPLGAHAAALAGTRVGELHQQEAVRRVAGREDD